MSFGIGIIVVGVLSIVVGQLPARWGRAVQGAGQTNAQTVGGSLMTVVGIVLVLVS